MTLDLRKASETTFPYGWPGIVMYAQIGADGKLAQCSRFRADFRATVRAAMAGKVQLIAAWPGDYRTDLFEIDDPAALAAAIGVQE
jgi:hypothetical protein